MRRAICALLLLTGWMFCGSPVMAESLWYATIEVEVRPPPRRSLETITIVADSLRNCERQRAIVVYILAVELTTDPGVCIEVDVTVNE